MRRSRFDAALEKRAAVNAADASGAVADSMAVREEIVRAIHAGEITLEQGQTKLKAIKRNAKKNGQLTRAQVYSQA